MPAHTAAYLDRLNADLDNTASAWKSLLAVSSLAEQDPNVMETDDWKGEMIAHCGYVMLAMRAMPYRNEPKECRKINAQVAKFSLLTTESANDLSKAIGDNENHTLMTRATRERTESDDALKSINAAVSEVRARYR